MRCAICGRAFRDNEKVVAVLRFVEAQRRDFVTSNPDGYIHLAHIEAAS